MGVYLHEKKETLELPLLLPELLSHLLFHPQLLSLGSLRDGLYRRWGDLLLRLDLCPEVHGKGRRLPHFIFAEAVVPDDREAVRFVRASADRDVGVRVLLLLPLLWAVRDL